MNSDSDPSQYKTLPNEPYIEKGGLYYSESQYKLAKKHNTYRWIFAMSIGIPALLILLPFLGKLGLIATAVVLPGIYALGTQLFPGSKMYGNALYKQFDFQHKAGVLKTPKGDLYNDR